MEDGSLDHFWFALAVTTIPKHSGNLDPNSQWVQVRIVLAAVSLQGFTVGIIVGCAHVFTEIATSSNVGD
jgi:hypothetical protein